MTSEWRVARALTGSLSYRTPTSFICRSCRRRALRQNTSLSQQSRSASGEPLPFTEKLRRKIWGTDNPPGLKDPYGGPSFLEKRRMRRETEETGGYTQYEQESYKGDDFESEYDTTTVAETQPDYTVVPQDYVPAETWDGLEHLGHKVSRAKQTNAARFEGHWADLPPKTEDSYEAFTGRSVLSLQNKDDVKECLSQAMVDVSSIDQDLPTGPLDVQDPATFQILKQFTKRSGYRVKDSIISRSKTWEILIDAISKDVAPKPKNIAEILMMRENLAQLPNLKIVRRRETPVDKEKEVGRWKVIEAELEERGLPVLGKVPS